MLAYVFWHRPAVEEGYEEALRAFHASLADTPSASFCLQSLPFGDGRPGYEDWYLVEDWAALGELNATAVDAAHRAPHDAAAQRADAGWGGVYKLVAGGPAEPPEAVEWDEVANTAQAVWQRQMVLGPAPEFCLVHSGPPDGRRRV